ncbi:MAG TPA: DUF4157 domain-containing protein [Kofleriaceae bacterium]
MEREQAHARGAHDDLDRDEQRRGGKHKPSSELAAPELPVTSGLVSRKADGNGVGDGAEDAVARASGSSGMSLPGTVMRKFESSLGADLSSVRVHTGAESQAAASSVGAKAYTVGQDIHFGAGQYDPSSHGGEHLLAHEVAHTVQQQGGSPTRQNKLEVSTPFDAAEHEADSAANAMVAGQSFSVGGGGGVQRNVFRKEQASTASEDDKEMAREKIMMAQSEAQGAVERAAHWTREQWAKFINTTVESQKVVWQPTLLRAGIATLVDKGIGAATKAVSKAEAAIPEAGWIVSKGIDALGDALGDAATEKIEGGKKLGGEAASSEGRAAALAALLAKLDDIERVLQAAQRSVVPDYQQVMRTLAAKDVDKGAVTETSTWADADIAKSAAVNPSGDRLYGEMLMNWVTTHVNDGNGGGLPGTNGEDLKKANQQLFGAEGIPNYYGLQIRMDLVELGLQTDQGIALAQFGKGQSGTFLVEHANDLEALALHFFKPQSPEFLYIVQGGQWSVTAEYETAQMSGDPLNGPGFTYLAAARYHLKTQGAPNSADDSDFIWKSMNAGENHSGQNPVGSGI